MSLETLSFNTTSPLSSKTVFSTRNFKASKNGVFNPKVHATNKSFSHSILSSHKDLVCVSSSTSNIDNHLNMKGRTVSSKRYLSVRTESLKRSEKLMHCGRELNCPCRI